MNRILDKQQAREFIVETLKPLDELVKTTYGPYGNYVAISNAYSQTFTKDGLSVISTLSAEDQLERNIIQDFVDLVKCVNDKNRDGSTTTSIVTYALIKGFVQDFTFPPFLVAKCILDEIPKIKDHIDSLSLEASEADKKEMLGVILNSDESLRDLIEGIHNNSTYEVIEGELGRKEYQGFKTNFSHPLQFIKYENGKIDIKNIECKVLDKALILYAREYPDLGTLYKAIKPILSSYCLPMDYDKLKDVIIISKRLNISNLDRGTLVRAIKTDFGLDVYIAGALLAPKDLHATSMNPIISHMGLGKVTLTKEALYLGDNTHYIFSLPSINEGDFKRKKDAIDDAFSIVNISKYVIGGGYTYYKLAEIYKQKAPSLISNLVWAVIATALLEPIKTLAEMSGVRGKKLEELYNSESIFNFAKDKSESIKETTVKESAESLKVMLEYSLRYLANYITIGSIIQQ